MRELKKFDECLATALGWGALERQEDQRDIVGHGSKQDGENENSIGRTHCGGLWLVRSVVWKEIQWCNISETRPRP